MSTMNSVPMGTYHRKSPAGAYTQQPPVRAYARQTSAYTQPPNLYTQPPASPYTQPPASPYTQPPASPYTQQPPAYHSPNPSPSLTQPIAIPATTPTLGSPFLRAYPIELEPFNISTPDFLTFLDELNRLMVVSPPVRVLGLAGDIVSFVPSATAQIVGGSLSAAATLTKYGMSKGRSELFLRESNKTLFAPRGLKIDIVKLEVVARAASIPILNADGKVDKNATLLAPLQGVYQDLSGQQRRLAALANWTSPLMLYPEEHVELPKTMMDSMHTYASERQRASEEKRILKKRTKTLELQRKDTEKIRARYDEEMGMLRDEEEKLKRKQGWRMVSQLEKVQREKGKVQRVFDEEMEKIMGDVRKKDKEEVAVRKVLWLMIQRADKDGNMRDW